MIAGIILAAGEGKRIGKHKLKLQLGSKSVIEWVLEATASSLLDEIMLVIKPDDKELVEIGKRWNATIMINPEYKKGMSTSIKRALNELRHRVEMNGFCLILGDQPFINPQIINLLIKNFSMGQKEIVVPYHQGKRGNPVLFDIAWKEEFMQVSGDLGGRVLIKKYPAKVRRVDISDYAVLFDIDREEDYIKARRHLEIKEE